MARKTGYYALLLVLMLTGFSAFAQDTTFNKTYDFNKGFETGTSVLALSDGYLIAASGSATEYDGWRGLKLLRTDIAGNEVWRKVYGRETKGFSSGWYGSMVELESGYVLAGGIADSGNLSCRAVLYRFDEIGDTIWTRTFDKGGYSFFNSMRQTPDKGYIVIGVHYVSNVNRYWLMKTDSLGIMEWDTVYTGAGYASTIEVTADGGYLIGGAGGSNLSTARIVKTDSLGNIQWSKNHFGGNPHGCYWAAGLASDGGYYIWGCWDTVIDPTDFYLVPVLAKLDNAGNRVWTRFYNNPNNRMVVAYQVKELTNGNIMLTGEKGTPSEPIGGGWVNYLDPTGAPIWEKIYYSNNDTVIGLGPNVIYDFKQTDDGGFIFTGHGFTDIDPGPNFNNNQDIWLLKLDSLGNWYAPPDTHICPPSCDTTGISELTPLQAKLYPNPTTPGRGNHLTVELPNANGQGHTLTLYNLLGQRMYEASLTGTTTTLQINITPGLYLYQIHGNGPRHGVVQNGKLVVE